MDIPGRVLTDPEVIDLMRPLQNDLIAFYSQLEQSVSDLFDQAGEKGWTPEELIKEINLLIDGDNRAPETQVMKARKLDGRTEFQGLPVSIENKAGSTREGVDQDGHEWSTTMIHPYGYIRGTKGTDGDHVDVFLGPNPEANIVYVVHIKDPETGDYDEDKCFLGFNSAAEARESFRKHYDRDDIFDSMDEIPFDRFVELLDSKKGQKIVNKALTLYRVQKSLRDLICVRKTDEELLKEPWLISAAEDANVAPSEMLAIVRNEGLI